MAFEWTTDVCRALIQHWQADMPGPQIAAKLGCRTQDVNGKVVHLRAKGIPLKKRSLRNRLDYKALAKYAREVSRAA